MIFFTTEDEFGQANFADGGLILAF